MSVALILEFEAKPEVGEQMGSSLKSALPDTRAFDGCISVDVLRNADNPNRWSLVERWESKAHHERYFQWRMETGFLEQMMAALVGEPKETWYETYDA